MSEDGYKHDLADLVIGTAVVYIESVGWPLQADDWQWNREAA